MTAKKRTNPLKRTTTDATKAKLPKPRKRKVKLADVEPAPDFRVVPIPCMDWPADSLPSGVAYTVPIAAADAGRETYRHEYTPPDTAPYPWPVRVREWVADRVEPLRWWLALKLERLAHWVAP